MGRQESGYKPDFWAMCKVTKFPKAQWEPFVEQVKAKAEEEREKCIANGFKFDDMCVDYAQSMSISQQD